MEHSALTNANDTICAISTPAGVGGIAVCRISGPNAISIADSIWHGRKLSDTDSHTAHLGEVIDSLGQPLDQAVATTFRSPRSFTGEDVVEIAVHGSRFVQRELLNALISAGARLAEPGEFTRRAFASGRFDLAEAEAVADVIASESRAAHRIALNQMKGGFSRRLLELRQSLVELVSLMELELDFSEEDVEFASREKLTHLAEEILAEVSRLHNSFAAGTAIKDGIPVAIVGDTNAGKSSLLNLILGDDRAIVSDIHGTTRDTIEETIDIGDYRFRFIDTAGLRHTDDRIEQIGISRSIDALNRASIILMVSDVTQPFNAELIDRLTQLPQQIALVAILNKIDLSTADDIAQRTQQLPARFTTLPLCALSHAADNQLEALRNALVNIADCEAGTTDILVTNARHAEALGLARESLQRVLHGLENGISGDFVSQDIRETLHHLATITGEIPSTEILSTIFSRFCIGK